MALRGLLRLKTRAQPVGVVNVYMRRDVWVRHCLSMQVPKTKQVELRFHTVLGHSCREVRLEWGTG